MLTVSSCLQDSPTRTESSLLSNLVHTVNKHMLFFIFRVSLIVPCSLGFTVGLLSSSSLTQIFYGFLVSQ
jgi:hypothetical protein